MTSRMWRRRKEKLQMSPECLVGAAQWMMVVKSLR